MTTDSKKLETLMRRDLYTWMKHRALLPSGKPYSFEGHEYMEAIAKHSWVPGDHVYIMKSSQCGASELSIDWMLWMQERNLPDWQGIAYLFPATEQLRDHIKARVIPIVEQPRFAKFLKSQNLRFFKYNNRPIYFRAAQTRRDLISWSADGAVMDEFDEFGDPIAAVDTIAARFNHSKYKWILGLSTPTYPDIGIDAAYGMSIQHHWFTECSECKEKFSPLQEVITSNFESCVIRNDEGTVGFLCPHCGELTQTNGAPGEWRVTNEGKGKKQRYGYSISRLFVGHANLESLLEKYEDAHNMQEFYNSDLGLPYSPANARITRGDLMDCATGDTNNHLGSKEPTIAGIDVGKKCHYIIANQNEAKDLNVIAYGTCTFDDLPELLRKFSVDTLVIDLRPEEQSVKKLIRGHRRWFASDYNTSNAIDWYDFTRADTGGKGGSIRVVKNHRTQTCDALIEAVAVRKRFTFPQQIKQDNQFLKQMCALQRMEKKENDTGEIRAYYGNGGKADHYFHAAAYLFLASLVRRTAGFARPGPQFHG
jgi:hypothetical protein